MLEGEDVYYFNSHGVRDKDAKRMAKEDSLKGLSEEEDNKDKDKEGGVSVEGS
jgi:hypothetical protein